MNVSAPIQQGKVHGAGCPPLTNNTKKHFVFSWRHTNVTLNELALTSVNYSILYMLMCIKKKDGCSRIVIHLITQWFVSSIF